MKFLFLLLVLAPFTAWAGSPSAFKTDEVPAVTVSPGVILKELTGRTAPGSARSKQCSVAWFHLEPGRASAWSFTKVGEESFFVLKGHGDVWTGDHANAVGPGSFIVVPAKMVRSVRADKGQAVEFYAVTSPAWSPQDDVMAQAPSGFVR